MEKFKKTISDIGRVVALFVSFALLWLSMGDLIEIINIDTTQISMFNLIAEYVFWLLGFFFLICQFYFVWDVFGNFINLNDLDYCDRTTIESEYNKLKHNNKKTIERLKVKGKS